MFHLSPAAAAVHTARLHSAWAPLLTGCLLVLRLLPSDWKGSSMPKDPHRLHLCGVQGRMRTDRVQIKGTVEAGAGRPEDTKYYKYPCPLVKLQNSSSKRQVTEHANCHTEGCRPTVVKQLGAVLHQTHYLSVRYGNSPNESLWSVLAAVGCRRSPGSSLNPRPPIRDP